MVQVRSRMGSRMINQVGIKISLEQQLSREAFTNLSQGDEPPWVEGGNISHTLTPLPVG